MPDSEQEKKQNLTPRELKARMDEGTAPLLLDVREPEENRIATLGGTLIPLAELPYRMPELEQWRDREIVVVCHHGVRSAHAAAHLRHQGFTRVYNLTGGIDRWSVEVDPKVPRY